MMTDQIVLIFAFVFFILAAMNIGHPRVNFVALGLALFVATLVF